MDLRFDPLSKSFLRVFSNSIPYGEGATDFEIQNTGPISYGIFKIRVHAIHLMETPSFITVSCNPGIPYKLDGFRDFAVFVIPLSGQELVVSINFNKILPFVLKPIFTQEERPESVVSENTVLFMEISDLSERIEVCQHIVERDGKTTLKFNILQLSLTEEESVKN